MSSIPAVLINIFAAFIIVSPFLFLILRNLYLNSDKFLLHCPKRIIKCYDGKYVIEFKCGFLGGWVNPYNHPPCNFFSFKHRYDTKILARHDIDKSISMLEHKANPAVEEQVDYKKTKVESYLTIDNAEKIMEECRKIIQIHKTEKQIHESEKYKQNK